MRAGLLAIFLVLSGCAGDGGRPPKDSRVDDTAGGDDSGGGGGDDVSPHVVSVDTVSCTEQQSAGDVWLMQITVSDPQGAETVNQGVVTVLSSEGGVIDEVVLACGSGGCTGTMRASDNGVDCTSEGSISLSFVVTDEDGNSSSAKVYDT